MCYRCTRSLSKDALHVDGTMVIAGHLHCVHRGGGWIRCCCSARCSLRAVHSVLQWKRSACGKKCSTCRQVLSSAPGFAEHARTKISLPSCMQVVRSAVAGLTSSIPSSLSIRRFLQRSGDGPQLLENDARTDARRVRRPGISLPPPVDGAYRPWDGAFEDPQAWRGGGNTWQVNWRSLSAWLHASKLG